MWVNSFHSSISAKCGISIFSRHLCRALLPLGIKVRETNLRTFTGVARTRASLIHYVPSGFVNAEASRALAHVLLSSKDDEKILIILHGLHGHGEDRFQNDTVCPGQERHIWLMLHRAECIVALSEVAANACRTWQTRFGGKALLVRLDHPGLFATMRRAGTAGSYALVGGISRSKKDHRTGEIGELIELCENRGIRIWQHWTNVERPQSLRQSWRQTSGLLTDSHWGSLLSHAQVVLCPYQTRIQSVSGLISEALSAGRFVLATGFELALEMQRRVPAQVCVEDNLQCWPDLILQLPSSPSSRSASVPTWDSFAKSIAVALETPDIQCSRASSAGQAITSDWSYDHGERLESLSREPRALDSGKKYEETAQIHAGTMSIPP
jgi:hypothetical protein